MKSIIFLSFSFYLFGHIHYPFSREKEVSLFTVGEQRTPISVKIDDNSHLVIKQLPEGTYGDYVDKLELWFQYGIIPEFKGISIFGSDIKNLPIIFT